MKRLTTWLLISIVCLNLPAQEFSSGNNNIVEAFNLAKHTVDINVRRGILAAGGDYGGEWTRDIAINAWFGTSLLRTAMTEKSLWSVTINKDTIGHQYWDKIIWATAALEHYKVTGNKQFLKEAYHCIANTMDELERTQFDNKYGLFKGPSVFHDGISGYPSSIYDNNINSSYVLDHKNSHHIKCLSTNCVYYNGYKVLAEMGKELNVVPATITNFQNKADAVKANILKHLYNKDENRLYYLIDHLGNIEKAEERLGISFAIIFGIIKGEAAHNMIKNIKQSPFGVTNIYPHFEGFQDSKPASHGNILWPMVNGFFAQAAIITENYKAFDFELDALQKLALDEDKGNYNFWEIYNPVTGKPYGGWQASNKDVPFRFDELWSSKRYQTWSATAYMNMVLYGICGLRFENNGILFQPYLPSDCNFVTLSDIKYRNAVLTISVSGKGTKIASFKVNGKLQKQAFVSANMKGKVNIEVALN